MYMTRDIAKKIRIDKDFKMNECLSEENRIYITDENEVNKIKRLITCMQRNTSRMQEISKIWGELKTEGLFDIINVDYPFNEEFDELIEEKMKVWTISLIDEILRKYYNKELEEFLRSKVSDYLPFDNPYREWNEIRKIKIDTKCLKIDGEVDENEK